MGHLLSKRAVVTTDITSESAIRYWNCFGDDSQNAKEGVVLYPDGSCYYGPISHGQREGFGIYIESDGKTMHESNWCFDALHGTCSSVYPNGSKVLSTYISGKQMTVQILQHEPLHAEVSCPAVEPQVHTAVVCSPVSDESFGHRTRRFASSQFFSTSSSAYVPRAPSRAEAWFVPMKQLDFTQRISSVSKCASCPVVYRGVWLGKDVVIRTYLNVVVTPTTMEYLSRMARIRHPNICLFMAASFENEKLCIISEYIPKMEGKVSTIQNILHVAKGIAVGCAYLKKLGYAHKNLKPNNILIDQTMDVKLSDHFAKEFHNLYHSIPCCATDVPVYVAPESLRANPFVPYGIDSASDVYSFGIILWELTTNQRPYANLSLAQLRILVGYAAYRETHTNSLSKFIQRCIQQDPTKRGTFDRLVVALNSMHSTANSAAEDALISFISGR